jgi:hypothetical protein
MKRSRTASATLASATLWKAIRAIRAVAVETRAWRAGLTGEGPATLRRQRAAVAATLAATPTPGRERMPARGRGRGPVAVPSRGPAAATPLLRPAP